MLGWDAAGVVDKVGAEVTLFRAGDAVFYAGALTRPGTNAEQHLVDERLVGSKPKSLDFAEAAALPLTSITAWELIFARLPLQRADSTRGTLLVINGAGGVGSILIQLARRLTDLTVIATASRPETAAWAKHLGAHHVVDHSRPLDHQVRALDIEYVQYIAALTASDRHAGAMAEIIAPEGHIVLIDDPKTFDIVPFKRKSVSLGWELMFTRSLFATSDMAEQGRILGEVANLVDAGALRTTLTERAGAINATNLKRVHQLVEGGRAYGKTVLEGF